VRYHHRNFCLVESTVKGRYLRSLIAVAVLVALWFAFRAWNKHKSHEATQKAEAKTTEKIFSVPAHAVTSFTVSTRDGKSFTCDREGKIWKIVKPLPVAADQSKVSSFLSSLTTANVNQVIASHPTDLKDFGLAPPDEKIQVLTHTTPQEFTLLVGDETPTSDGAYAQVSGDSRVFTLSDDTKTSLEKSMFDLRDTRAVTLSTDQIDRIVGKAGKQSYTLAKNPEGVWEVSIPPDVRADHFTVDGLVDNLQSLSMGSVVAEQKRNDPQYGFGKPTLTLQLTTPSTSQTLIVGGKTKTGTYYAENSGLAPVFTLDSSSISQFEKGANDFRDKDLFSWDMFDVKSFDVTSPEGHWTFQQQKTQWKETAPATKAASSDNVNAFLSALRNLDASSFPQAQPGKMDQFGFNKPSYTFKVTFGAKNQTETVEVAKAGGHVYARRESDPLPSEVSQSDLTSIEKAFAKISK
jgi:Domain of unknown function (DUF4340)